MWIAEVASHDLHGRAGIGVSVVASDSSHACAIDSAAPSTANIRRNPSGRPLAKAR